MPTADLYPANPANVPDAVTSPSASFKKEVSKVLITIFLFFIVYLLLIAGSLALAAACIYGGVMVIFGLRHTLGIIAGVGIMSIGVLVFFFLVKFIFSVRRQDDSNNIEITEDEQPLLFAFIRQLTADTQTRFPKKIVLSQDVNAFVYYNDSFWSMLFPVRKNLNIGLGLVNTLTISEFKAVMAHEFGHFSQRSMKLGSFVYNVNKVIYNMLFENNSFNNFLRNFGSVHAVISFFLLLTVQIINGIQKVLQLMYGFINKSYMGLSRQMEFHADAVAASVCGSKPLVTALRKLEVSDTCYQNVIGKANHLLQESKRLLNIYQNHDVVMEHVAQLNSMPLQNNAPLPDDNNYQQFIKGRIVIKDQWASHPPREEREKHLLQLAIEAIDDTRPAWLLFEGRDELQEKLSNQLYEHLAEKEKLQTFEPDLFKEYYRQEIQKYTLPPVYNEYYDGRNLEEFDIDEYAASVQNTTPPGSDNENFFGDEWKATMKKISSISQDIALLEAMNKGELKIKSFDFDGQKKKRKEATALLPVLQQELSALQEKIKQQDITILKHYYQKASMRNADVAADYVAKYKAVITAQQDAVNFVNSATEIMEIFGRLSAGQEIPLAAASNMAYTLEYKVAALKPYFKKLLEDGAYDSRPKLKEQVHDIVTRSFTYYTEPRFKEWELTILYEVITQTPLVAAELTFLKVKDWLEFQVQLMD